MKEKTCDSCIHQTRCKKFFEERYKRLGLKEPESLSKTPCKAYNKTKGRHFNRLMKIIEGGA